MYRSYRLAHRNLDGYSQRGYRMAHRNLDGATTSRAYRMRRRNLDGLSMYRSYRLAHRNLDGVTSSRAYRLAHRSLDGQACPRYRMKHHRYDGATCGPSYRLAHRNLDGACMYRGLRLKHRNLDGLACGTGYRIRHRNLDGAGCGTGIRIPHRNMDRYQCEDLIICHTPLHKYKVFCDPNIQQPTSNLERVGRDIRNLFTNHRRHCKVMNTYSGVGAGALVEVPRYGTVQVVDFIIRNRTYTHLHWGPDSTGRFKKEKRRIKSVDRLVVHVPRRGLWRTVDGRPHVKKVRLTRDESKQVMLAHLVQRDQVAWLIRMYPEERPNLEAIRLRYAPNAPYHRPLWYPPRLNFNQD
jgi:hypothetical protein